MQRDVPLLKKHLKTMHTSLEAIQSKLDVAMTKLQEEKVDLKSGMTYLELKYNLMLSYC